MQKGKNTMTKTAAENLAKCVENATVRALTTWQSNDIIKWDSILHPRDNNGRFTNGNTFYAPDGMASAGDTGRGTDDTSFSNCTPQEFHDAISKAKESRPETDRWRVDVHSPEDYTDDILHITAGGSTVAVTGDGDIISVCKAEGDTVRGVELMEMAVKNGGVKLDSYGGNHGFYTKKCGFEPISWVPFDEKYAPDGWVKGRDNAEPVIFYKYTGNKSQPSIDDFLNSTPASVDYDSAKETRDKLL